jgi:putative ABC transport system substrate-binding protein
MDTRFRTRVLNSHSDNRKSKIQNRKFVGIVALVLTLAMCGAVATAQQSGKVPRIGFLSAAPSIDPAFLEGLRNLGYVDGKNIVIELRSAEGKLERLPELAADLVNLKVDVIVTQGTPSAQAAKKATNTIPVVMATSGDAVGTGLVASLARPGGNVTGLSILATDLDTKWLELLKEAAPNISRVAWLANPAIVPEMISLKNLQSVGPSLGVAVQLVEMRGPESFESSFATVVQDRFNAVIVTPNSSYVPHRQQLVSLTAKHRLPAMYGWKEFPEAGGLMSYGVILPDLFRRAAVYVDKILKGTKPADLPVEQPMKFEFVINLKAAKQIGLTIPPNVLARADKVIR